MIADRDAAAETGGLTIADEDTLWSLLDEHMNANGVDPQVAGLDAEDTPFLAWLDEEGGDCVGLRVVRLLPNDGGVTSTPGPVEAPGQGDVSALTYPLILAARRAPAPVAEPLDGYVVSLDLTTGDVSTRQATTADHAVEAGGLTEAEEVELHDLLGAVPPGTNRKVREWAERILAARRAPAPVAVTSVEPGCTCGGMAACQQCQDRDAAPVVRHARGCSGGVGGKCDCEPERRKPACSFCPSGAGESCRGIGPCRRPPAPVAGRGDAPCESFWHGVPGHECIPVAGRGDADVAIKAQNPDLDTAWRTIAWWQQTCAYWHDEAHKGYAVRDSLAAERRAAVSALVATGRHTVETARAALDSYADQPGEDVMEWLQEDEPGVFRPRNLADQPDEGGPR